jgi:hypothetical protein
MYRLEDIDKINDNLSKIQDDSANEYKTLYEPTLNEISNVYNSIREYIKKKGRILYGGFAQNLLIMAKNKNDSFYKEINGAFYNWPDLADIEFYSTDPIQDTIDLTNFLHSKGFKHIQGKEGIHRETYKIFVNFLNYCDISYVPPNVYNTIPYIEVNGMKCTHPHFMMVDTYRILTDPMTSYWRLDKAIKRFQKLLKYYPINSEIKETKLSLNGNKDTNILKIIRRKFIHNTKLIIVGFYAFDYYMKKADKNYMINNHLYYEVISTELMKDSRYITNVLKKKYKKRLTIKEFNPYFTFMDKRIEYYLDNNLVLRLFGNNDRCIVYKYSQKKKCYFGTYNLVFMYLLFNYFYHITINDKYNTNLFNILISRLHYARNKYLEENNITVLDNSPFQDFTIKCFGMPVDPIRSALLDGITSSKKHSKFIYIPGNKNKVSKKIYSNNSGLEI